MITKEEYTKMKTKLSFIRALFSPFKPFGVKFYFGKIAIGMPYFFPRTTVKDPDKPGYLKFKPKKFGFDICPLGWKTKWSDTNYRLEWQPRISFVFWKWQFAIIIQSEYSDHYWESWLYYERNTDKKKSKTERIKQCQKEFPQTYKSSYTDGSETIDYYKLILRDKYKPLSIDESRDEKLKQILK